MTQYSKHTNSLLSNNKTIYEVVMLADREGNIGSGGNFLGTGVDAFGRARFSQPYTLFDSANIFEKNNKFDESVSNSGTSSYILNESSVGLNVTDASGDEVIRESKRVFSYQPGKSLLIMNSFVMNEGKENLRQRVGYFDTQNGVYLEQDGTTTYVVLRSYSSGSVVETRISQDSWNVDIMDGSSDSTSGITLDLTKTQIFWIDVEWLGVGTVRCGFVVNGELITVHKFHHANIADAVYMTTPNLPIRYEITNTGATSGNSLLKQTCSTVISEGGYEATAISRTAGSASVGGVTVGTSYVNLVTIQLNRLNAVVVPSGADILNVSNTDFQWGLFLNATPSAPFTFNPATNNVNFALDTVGFTAMGTQIEGGFMGGKTAPVALGDGGFDWTHQLGRTLAGVSDTLTLAVKSASSSKTAAGLLKWYEV